jgi:hypothetical protein
MQDKTLNISNKNTHLFFFSVYSNDFETFKWCYENYNDNKISVIQNVLTNGNIEIINFMYSISILTRKTLLNISYSNIIISDKLEVLEWFAEKFPEIISDDSIKMELLTRHVHKNKKITDWILAKGVQKSDQLYNFAVHNGLLNLTIECHKLGYKSDVNVCEIAASNNDFNMLTWAIDNGYKITNFVCIHAMIHNNLSVIQHIYKNDYLLFTNNISNGIIFCNLNTLKWFKEINIEFTENVYIHSIIKGNFDIFVWLIENSILLKTSISETAAKLLKTSIGETAAKYGRLRFIKFAYEKGMQMDFNSIYKICRAHDYYKICRWINANIKK